MYEILIIGIALFVLWFFFGPTREDCESCTRIARLVVQTNPYREFDIMIKRFLFLGFLMLVADVAFWGGLIYFTFWCLKHFGVIV